MKRIVIAVGLMGTLLVMGCQASGDTRRPASEMGGDDEAARVTVFKYDGSVQCGSQGVASEAMAQELRDAGIEIHCSRKAHDGLMRIALCGADTGNINLYGISRRKLTDVERLGYKDVKSLPAYRGGPCEDAR